ncbi:DNA-directed RNA polymerase III subunit RPC7-like [Macadamia integrifolia]|uniref:DNA-directed RNA polymerase III subunit RPC7-like n=1 Tax=Macadamia integrifolia TaxID=60698 RepID=UPI001C4FA5F5|nr:DNA-directed RNA polymerase III subunit RPC7-like [Macadamia integrifolia]
MAFRGRGRGRGRGGYRGGERTYAVQEPYILFPEDVELPDVNGVIEEKTLVYWNMRLLNYWKSSPYYIEATAHSKSQDADIERYSDKGKRTKTMMRPPLSQHLKLSSAYFPLELIQGKSRVQHDHRKVRWNPEADLQKLDIFEKLEQKFQVKDEKGEKEKNEDENDDEDEEQIEEEEEEFSDPDDYEQNVDFDDDEDDFNMDDGNDNEAIY